MTGGDNDRAGGDNDRAGGDNDRVRGDNDRACSGGGVSEGNEWDRGWKEDYTSHHCEKLILTVNPCPSASPHKHTCTYTDAHKHTCTYTDTQVH